MSAKRREPAPEAKAPETVPEAPEAPVVAPEDAPEADPQPEATEPPMTGYRVAQGRAITSRRGILVAGEVVLPERDGISDVDELVRIGAVVRA